MAQEDLLNEEETWPLKQDSAFDHPGRTSLDSVSSVSTTSVILEGLNDLPPNRSTKRSQRRGSYSVEGIPDGKLEEYDVEDGVHPVSNKAGDKKVRRILWMLGGFFVSAWVLAFVVFLSSHAYRHSSSRPHDPAATVARGSGKKITLDQVLSGQWHAKSHSISWVAGANGEDGLLLERASDAETNYLVVEDVRSRNNSPGSTDSKTLMKKGSFQVGDAWVFTNEVWPSPDLKSVLVMSEREHNWRHSYTGKYWIFDVASQTGQALDPSDPHARIQLASWSPQSDAVVFTRDNNMFLRELPSSKVTQITKDGGRELFYGVPDWVYEEEVFSANSATWWAKDGKYLAFLRTNESAVPEYPIQYFVSRPSGKKPALGEENYPEVRKIKYPKAGASNPTVDLQFYDVEKAEVFSVNINGDFPSPDRLITEVVWAGSSGKVLIRETNRESDILAVVLIDVKSRTGKVVRTVDVNAIDGGWFEVSQETRYIPADPANNRPHDGYIDTVIHDNYDHLGYFTPLDNPNATLLTSGAWEVVNAPAAVDLDHNIVYFIGTKEGPIQRHVYSVKLDGSDLRPMTDTTHEGYHDVSFSKGSGYALLSYQGPKIPWQKVISTPSNINSYENSIEENKDLARMAAQHEMPIEIYQTVTIDGYELQVVERRPPHFNPNKEYPVLFFLYGGPGSQQVDKKFKVDFQSYIASNLGYIVVTVDGRGTGFIGRKARCIIRGNIGHYEARDQIETAKIWAQKKYVDENRMAIWGWSYGGFMTLKTLEQDGGRTFQYGMAVAPVTDWKFYDSIYTERYMHTPQHNPQGFESTSISNMTALGDTVRFLIMHGVADDNVHMQNSLTLLDKLDLAGVENYDVHVFPDSDHGIYFHNANKMVYDRLNNWLINAFNGEWLRTEAPVPYVDQLIGSTNGGNVFAGATLPYGMAKAVADVNGDNTGGFATDGSNITGFSQLHDSGTGGDASLGNFALFPYAGCLNDTIDGCTYPKLARAIPYINESVVASPGYFNITLSSQIAVDMTVSNHTSLYRFKFPSTPIDGSPLSPLILMDLTDLSDSRYNGTINVDNSTGRMTGNATYEPSFGSGTYNAYFCVDFQGAAIRDSGIWVNSRASNEPETLFITRGINGYPLPGGAFTRFEAPEANNTILARVGISFISSEKACSNAETEIPSWDFEGTKSVAEDAWRIKLSPISVTPGSGVSVDIQKIFWSSIYRTMINPQDYTGENPLWDSDEPYFDSFYCLWDSFRSQLPFLTILDPDTLSRIIRALINIYEHEGYLPDCRMSLCKGYTQGGSNADNVIVDAYVKNVTGPIDWATAYQAIVHDAEDEPLDWSNEGRGGLTSWKALNYIPAEDFDYLGFGTMTRSISRTLEYAYNDFCISQMADGMGHVADREKYQDRSENWKNLWKADQTSYVNGSDSGFTGFPQPRYLNQTFGYQDPALCSNLVDGVCSLQNSAHETFESSIWEYSL
ncbi:MAG: hypothetical protein M1819_004987 [Sarea resinae]|nr:MAG: hypothetical protein M1819_004987 [Sarea resinae]